MNNIHDILRPDRIDVGHARLMGLTVGCAPACTTHKFSFDPVLAGRLLNGLYVVFAKPHRRAREVAGRVSKLAALHSPAFIILKKERLIVRERLSWRLHQDAITDGHRSAGSKFASRRAEYFPPGGFTRRATSPKQETERKKEKTSCSLPTAPNIIRTMVKRWRGATGAVAPCGAHGTPVLTTVARRFARAAEKDFAAGAKSRSPVGSAKPDSAKPITRSSPWSRVARTQTRPTTPPPRLFVVSLLLNTAAWRRTHGYVFVAPPYSRTRINRLSA